MKQKCGISTNKQHEVITSKCVAACKEKEIKCRFEGSIAQPFHLLALNGENTMNQTLPVPLDSLLIIQHIRYHCRNYVKSRYSPFYPNLSTL